MVTQVAQFPKEDTQKSEVGGNLRRWVQALNLNGKDKCAQSQTHNTIGA